MTTGFICDKCERGCVPFREMDTESVEFWGSITQEVSWYLVSDCCRYDIREVEE